MPHANHLEAVERALFSGRVQALCEEMGAALQRAALSPNIKDRRDYSCALFAADGALVGQSAAIPVHLGSMAYAMESLARAHTWSPGVAMLLNDPYLGGTHLPDVTLIHPAFDAGALIGFVVNRAHHADIGADAPGSMPISRTLDEEGVVIPPTWVRASDDPAILKLSEHLRDPESALADFAAQFAANRTGLARLGALLADCGGVEGYQARCRQQFEYARDLARTVFADIPDGTYRYQDVLDDDGVGTAQIPIVLRLDARDGTLAFDFTGSSPQVAGNVNCPLPVTAAAVTYVLRCLLPAQAPACAGLLDGIVLQAPERSVVNAERPAAVAAGNVETSQRICDVVLGALASALPERIPAAAQGTMNNIAFGGELAGRAWSYYETVGGGMGAGPMGPGLSATQCHMTNTLNTPAEILEQYCPVRITRYAVRDASGGAGRHAGGDGIVRQFRFLAPAQVSIIGERRASRPWGLNEGAAGAAGEDLLDATPLPGKTSLRVEPGQSLTVLTPGGGGWGPLANE